MSEPLFTEETCAIVYGLQQTTIQRMLGFDYVCGRERPSVGAVVEPTANEGFVKVAWGAEEVMIPVHTNISAAREERPDLDVVLNFASARSAAAATREALGEERIRAVAILAEGVAERAARELGRMARDRGIVLLGPASIGAIKAGCFRVGNMGGAIENILSARLHRPGSVAYVTRSGGLANELNLMLSQTTDGVYEGVAIGGDRFPGSTFLDHLQRWEEDSAVRMTVMIGELGGELELDVTAAIHRGELMKPLVAWCLGSSSVLFPRGAQFGHAGAAAASERESAVAKNRALAEAGAHVPEHFEGLRDMLAHVFRSVAVGDREPRGADGRPRPLPMDFASAREQGLVRRPTNFVCTISDDRGDEPTYAGVPISEVTGRLGLGGAIGLLWLRKELSLESRRFVELLLIVLSSREAAVAGTRATALAVATGRDLVSAVSAGLLTVGPRFGGAVDASAIVFTDAVERGLTPGELVMEYESRGERIPGIGYPTRDLTDMRAREDLVCKLATELLARTPILDFAVELGSLMSERNARLMLNIDGAVGAATADLLREGADLDAAEARRYLELGVCQALFAMGRLLDFIGHAIDLRRLASVGFVTTSEVLLPEFAELIARNADGVRDSLVVGGARFPTDGILDHLQRFERDPRVSMTVVAADAGQRLCEVCRAVAEGGLAKPVVVWSDSACDKHGGACLLRHPRAVVAPPGSGSLVSAEDALGRAIGETYRRLVAEGVVARIPDEEDPTLDLAVDALYAGVPLHQLVAGGPDFGAVLSVLWFKRLLPAYAREFLTMTLTIVADHWPAVSGAHATIVASRAGKDLIDSLVSGILTIGPRFGGAIDEAARGFKWALEEGLSPEEFVAEKKRRGELVMGIGHRVRSLDRPDARVAILREFAVRHFPETRVLDFALEVERVTTAKRASLILNVDGCIAACMTDLLRSCGAFTSREADLYIDLGVLNGLFVLGRSIGMIGHHLDQLRMRQGLYRHPVDDIAYLVEDAPRR